MATSLLALLDDIATLLDDISVMAKVSARKAVVLSDDVAVLTKASAQKTAGVLGDDLALNAQQVTGLSASREIPVVWAVAKGSMVNKAILVPAALAISAFIPWAVTPLLMAGGAFLCYEGFEKVAHKLLHRSGHGGHDAASSAHAAAEEAALEGGQPDIHTDMASLEKQKIKGAVRTDFILSAEIIAITLGTVTGQDFWTQLLVLIGIALLMTVGVYGLVAGIVKLDDLGLYLSQRVSGAARTTGQAILTLAPWLMKFLTVAGTAAMFLVGGGILVHGVPALAHWIEAWTAGMAGVGRTGLEMLFNAAVGVVAGAVVVGVVSLVRRLRH